MFYRCSELWLHLPLLFFWILELGLVFFWIILGPGSQCKLHALRCVGFHTHATWSLSSDSLFHLFTIYTKLLTPAFLDFLLILPSLNIDLLPPGFTPFLWFSQVYWVRECCSSRLIFLKLSWYDTKRHSVHQRLQVCSLTFCLSPFSHVILHSFLKQKGQRPCGIAGRALGIGSFVDWQFFYFIS